jgi:hypothetical protein
MIQRDRPNISELIADHKLIEAALRRGVREAMIRHKKLGQSVVGFRDGRPVIIPPEEIVISEEPADAEKP